MLSKAKRTKRGVLPLDSAPRLIRMPVFSSEVKEEKEEHVETRRGLENKK
jgi:hypothetical protein